MEDAKQLSVPDISQRSRPLSATASLQNSPAISRKPSNSLSPPCKKRKILPSEKLQSSEALSRVKQSGPNPNPNPRVISSLNHPAFLFGTVDLPDSTSNSPICSKTDCLSFSDGSSSVCCVVLDLNVKIIGKRIRVLGWNFVPFKCKGGCLEIIRWDLVKSEEEGINPGSSPLISLSFPSRIRPHFRICGKLVSVSPVVVVPCTILSRRPQNNLDTGFTNNGNMKGFLAEIMVCECSVSSSGVQHLENDHSFSKAVIVYFCGPTSSWHPIISHLLGHMVSVSGIRKKSVSIGREESHEMLVATEKAAVYLSQLPSEPFLIDRMVISGKGELGIYMGTVTSIYLQGMIVELDNKVWLLLTDQLLGLPHFLRVGATVSLTNVHFVRPQFSWIRMLLLGACFKTSVSIKSFSPFETQSYYRFQNQSLLGKFIESLTFSARFWVLLTISCFKKKFAGIFSEKEILGSKHKEGLAQTYASSCLPLTAFRPRNKVFLEFCNHDLCGCGSEPKFEPLNLVVPISNFISNCEAMWINILLQMQNQPEVTEIDSAAGLVSCEGKSHRQLIRRIICSKDIGVALMGTLEVSSSTRRLQMVDATGKIDVVIPDLLSNGDLNKIYEVKSYSLVLEGLPAEVGSSGAVTSDMFSCKSIFNHVQSKRVIDLLSIYVHFYLKMAVCLNVPFRLPCKTSDGDLKGSRGGRFHILLVTHKFPATQIFQDAPTTADNSSLFAEGIILPYDLFLPEKYGDDQLIEISMDDLKAHLGYVDSNHYPENLSSKTPKNFQASNEARHLIPCKDKSFNFLTISSDYQSLSANEHKFSQATNKGRHLITCRDKLFNLGSPLDVPCSLIVSSRGNQEHFVLGILSHANRGNPDTLKVLLEFKSEMFHQYELLRIGVYYIMKYEKEEFNEVLTGGKALVTPQSPLWSISISPADVLVQTELHPNQPMEASSISNTQVLLVNLPRTEVLSNKCALDARLYLSSEAADHLKKAKETLENGHNSPSVSLGEIVSISTCIGTMMAASFPIYVTSNLSYRMPEGNLISVHGNIVHVHGFPSSQAICIHVCDNHHMVRIHGTFMMHTFPIGLGPGVNATFHRVLMTGRFELMLTAASFIVINSIKEADIHYYGEQCSLPIASSYNVTEEIVSMTLPGLISNLFQSPANQLVQFRCRVVAVHILVLEKQTEKFDKPQPIAQFKMPGVRIPFAGFIVDDGSSSCCCWADAGRAATLLRLNETSLRVYKNGWWNLKCTRSNKSPKTTGYYLEKMLKKHHRVVVKKYASLLESSSLDFTISVDSNKEISTADENLLKFIILNACCGTVLSVVGSNMDSNDIERLKHFPEIQISLHQMQNIWTKEVGCINPLQEARNIIQELVTM